MDIACDPELVKLAASLTSLPVNSLIETSIRSFLLDQISTIQISLSSWIQDMNSNVPANLRPPGCG